MRVKITLPLVLFFIGILLFIFSGKFIMEKTIAAYTSQQQSNSTTPDKGQKLTVCLDPGHGGYDVGTKSSSGIYEKNVTLEIALKVGKILEKNNIKVIYTRNSDKVPWPSNEKEDLRTRAKISNDAKADLFVSIHCNGNTNSSYKGIETWCRFPNTEGEKFAKTIQKELSSYNYSSDRGIKYESEKSLAVLKFTDSVSALVELGFLTNSSDEKFITSESGKEKCAEAVVKAILSYGSSYKNEYNNKK